MRGWGQSRRGWTAAALAVLALLALPAESRGQTTHGEQAAPAERKVKVRHIAIEGVLRVPAETLFGLIPIAEGMELSPLALEERIRQTVRNIFQMENFSDARIYKVDVEEGVIDLVVVVTEKFVDRKSVV